MADDFDWKKFQFISTVQTALINNAINRSHYFLEHDGAQPQDWFMRST